MSSLKESVKFDTQLAKQMRSHCREPWHSVEDGDLPPIGQMVNIATYNGDVKSMVPGYRVQVGYCSKYTNKIPQDDGTYKVEERLFWVVCNGNMAVGYSRKNGTGNLREYMSHVNAFDGSSICLMADDIENEKPDYWMEIPLIK